MWLNASNKYESLDIFWCDVLCVSVFSHCFVFNPTSFCWIWSNVTESHQAVGGFCIYENWLQLILHKRRLVLLPGFAVFYSKWLVAFKTSLKSIWILRVMNISTCVHIHLYIVYIYTYTSIGDLKPFQPFIKLMLPVAIFHSFSDDWGSMEGGASRHAQCSGSSLASRRFVWGRHIPIVSTGLVYLPTWIVDLHGKCRYAGMPYMDPMGCRNTKIIENI